VCVYVSVLCVMRVPCVDPFSIGVPRDVHGCVWILREKSVNGVYVWLVCVGCAGCVLPCVGCVTGVSRERPS